MPTESPNASSKSRHGDKTVIRTKVTAAQSKQNLRASQKHAAQCPKASSDEIARLREIINKLQSEQQTFQNKEMDDFSGSSDLRWKVNKLEKDKLELSTKYNDEVSRYEGEVAKLRAAVERGEAQRQNLEYDIALVRRDAMTEKNSAEEKAADLHSKTEKLQVHCAELLQRASDLEKALNLTRQARDEDQHALHSELEERDRLLMSANAECDHLATENKRLDALLQNQEDTLKELRRRMEKVHGERERDRESLRRQAQELHFVSEREHRFKMELEAAQVRLRTLDDNVESERAAHLESKLNSEVIQLHVRDLEAALQVEKSSQVEAFSSLELMKHKFGEVEKAYEQERDKAKDYLQQLAQCEKDYLATKCELSEELKEKRKAVTELTEALQAYERQQGQAQISLETVRAQHACLEESFEGHRRELEQTLRRCAVSDPRAAEEPGESCRLSLHTLMDTLRKTLGHYQDTLERTTRELHDVKKMFESAVQECKLYEEMNGTLKKNMEEAHVALARSNDEVIRLRADCTNGAAHANRTQADLSAIRHRWKVERERASEAEIEMQRLTQLYQKDSQEKLTFLHDLYQRLVAGCVLIKQPQGLLGSFSWPELCAVLQEHADALTSDLSRANEKISHLEFVCQNKSEAVRELQQTQESTFSKLAEQMKQREADWQLQRRDLEEHYSSLTAEVQARAKKWQTVADQAQEKADGLEKTKAETSVDLTRLQNLLPQTRREAATLLAACALLAGALCPLYGQLCSLSHQKSLLLQQLRASRAFEGEIRGLVRALTAEGRSREGREPGAKRAGGGARSFRKCAIAVMAARRFHRLGQRSQILFSLEQGLGDLPALSVCAAENRASAPCSGQDRAERHTSMALHWFQSKGLLDLVLSTVGELQESVTKEELGAPASRPGVLAAARSAFARLMERILPEMDGESRLFCREKGALSRRLGQGLNKLNATTPHGDTSKGAVAALQRLVLEFTQRLHSAEVERRSLRLELAELRRVAVETKEAADREEDRMDRRKPVGVPVEHFENVFTELSSALEREQLAQTLLHEQAQQLQELGVRLEQHSGEEAEKDQTLSEAVKSLSEAKMELKRKDQSLRQLGRHLSQLQQDKRQVEESILHAENALRMAAKSKDTLSGYMRTVESSLNDVKERILLSRATATREDFTLQLPRVHLDVAGAERLTGAPEMTACQSFVSTFMDVYQMACSRMALLEKEMASHQAHISDLKTELQDACLRENQCFIPHIGLPFGASDRIQAQLPRPPLLLAGRSRRPVPLKVFCKETPCCSPFEEKELEELANGTVDRVQGYASSLSVRGFSLVAVEKAGEAGLEQRLSLRGLPPSHSSSFSLIRPEPVSRFRPETVARFLPNADGPAARGFGFSRRAAGSLEVNSRETNRSGLQERSRERPGSARLSIPATVRRGPGPRRAAQTNTGRIRGAAVSPQGAERRRAGLARRYCRLETSRGPGENDTSDLGLIDLRAAFQKALLKSAEEPGRTGRVRFRAAVRRYLGRLCRREAGGRTDGGRGPHRKHKGVKRSVTETAQNPVKVNQTKPNQIYKVVPSPSGDSGGLGVAPTGSGYPTQREPQKHVDPTALFLSLRPSEDHQRTPGLFEGIPFLWSLLDV
ncbi:hypothetical protein SKAU_G00037980 [Synaphobranchus kaupii]|uniref:Coiled-coil domain-containing protein 171 n=1 Tax=Synaphobranchus kaupii TaxID=118154 RepID=A0A9Q1GGQ9_SYNKA|nr:hypothetical protein SKAU_G00037980 [Synaphobranchus kaupii]